MKKVLSYEIFINKAPYNHVEIYNSNLPENFDELFDNEKTLASKKAQEAAINHLMELDTPEANAYKKEMAGSYAYLIKHYQKMLRKLENDSKVLIPAGGHGGVMEFLLQQALVRKDQEGNEVIGFKTVKDIGGEFSPSDAYNVDISTNEEGIPNTLRVTFDSKERGLNEEMYLDNDTVESLANYYEDIHSEYK